MKKIILTFLCSLFVVRAVVAVEVTVDLTNLTLLQALQTQAVSVPSVTGLTITKGTLNTGDFNTLKGMRASLKTIIMNGATISDKKIPDGLFQNFDKLILAVLPNSTTSIGNLVFQNCSKLTSVTIPNGVTSIGANAFSGCSSLPTITFPDLLTSIGVSAFSDCNSLTTITLPDLVTSVGNQAFQNCKKITSINISYRVMNIGNLAFQGCSSLTSFNVSEENSFFMSENGILFNKSKTQLIQYPTGKTDESYIIPASVTSIITYAFYGCGNLTSINLPSGVTSIGANAFYNCNHLTSVNIPVGVTNIEGYVFYNCSNLAPIDIPSGVTNIGTYAFYNCSNITTINIPAGVTNIGAYAFSGCNGLTTVYARRAQPAILGSNVFTGVNQTTTCTLYVPSGSEQKYRSAAQWGEFRSIIGKNNITITFDTQGGTPASFTSEVFENELLTQPSQNPTRTDYVFGGWYKEASTITPWDFSTDRASQNITLYAKWVTNTYTISFSANGGSVNPTSKEVAYNTEIGTLPVPVRTGYTFTGWNTVQNGSGTTYTASTIYSTTGNITLYAQWKINTFRLIFDANGGNVNLLSTEVAYNSEVGTLPVPTRTGHTFTGWNTAPNGSGGTYTASTIYLDVTDITLYAQWSVNIYTVTFNANGGHINENDRVSQVFYGNTITAPNVSRTGYTFDGWYHGVTLWDFNTPVTADITLTAKWSSVLPNTYTVTFSGDAIDILPQVVTAGEKAIKPEDPVRTGYTFGGWYHGGTPWDFNAPVTVSIILTAKWIEASKTIYVVLYAGEGINISPQTIVEGEKIIKPADPIRTGYIFDGWYVDNMLWDFNTPVSSDLVLYAEWKEDMSSGYDDLLQADIVIYPNPFANKLHITGAEGCTLRVLNVIGATVCIQKLVNPDETVDLGQLSSGMYLFRLEKDGKAKTLKGLKR